MSCQLRRCRGKRGCICPPKKARGVVYQGVEPKLVVGCAVPVALPPIPVGKSTVVDKLSSVEALYDDVPGVALIVTGASRVDQILTSVCDGNWTGPLPTYVTGFHSLDASIWLPVSLKELYIYIYIYIYIYNFSFILARSGTLTTRQLTGRVSNSPSTDVLFTCRIWEYCF